MPPPASCTPAARSRQPPGARSSCGAPPRRSRLRSPPPLAVPPPNRADPHHPLQAAGWAVVLDPPGHFATTHIDLDAQTMPCHLLPSAMWGRGSRLGAERPAWHATEWNSTRGGAQLCSHDAWLLFCFTTRMIHNPKPHIGPVGTHWPLLPPCVPVALAATSAGRWMPAAPRAAAR